MTAKRKVFERNGKLYAIPPVSSAILVRVTKRELDKLNMRAKDAGLSLNRWGRLQLGLPEEPEEIEVK